ncbi:MAG: 30S ribosomal protein S9 [archaeon]
MTAAKRTKAIVTKGKKKTAIARVRIKEGKGSLRVKGKPIDVYNPEYAKQIILEPIIIAADVLGTGFEKGLDIAANVKGGGVMSQAQACRTAIGKALVAWSKNDGLKDVFAKYDRTIIVDDVRRKEAKKFLRKGARAKPIKSYR